MTNAAHHHRHHPTTRVGRKHERVMGREWRSRVREVRRGASYGERAGYNATEARPLGGGIQKKMMIIMFTCTTYEYSTVQNCTRIHQSEISCILSDTV